MSEHYPYLPQPKDMPDWASELDEEMEKLHTTVGIMSSLAADKTDFDCESEHRPLLGFLMLVEEHVERYRRRLRMAFVKEYGSREAVDSEESEGEDAKEGEML